MDLNLGSRGTGCYRHWLLFLGGRCFLTLRGTRPCGVGSIQMQKILLLFRFTCVALGLLLQLLLGLILQHLLRGELLPRGFL